MSYLLNKERAKTRNNGKPSLTDQSQARDTDINVIVGRFLNTGTAPGAHQAPMSGDFSNLPTDLRGMIETSRDLKKLRHKLPPELKDKPIEEILALTTDELTRILTPDANQPPNPGGNAGNPPVGQ